MALVFVVLAGLSTFGAGAPAWIDSLLVATLGGGFAPVNLPLTTHPSSSCREARNLAGHVRDSMPTG
jgi:hypothetical protein